MPVAGARRREYPTEPSVDLSLGYDFQRTNELVNLDSETEPSLMGTGSEDYFCAALGLSRRRR